MIRLTRDFSKASRRERVLVCMASTIVGAAIIIAVEQAQGIPLAVSVRNIIFTLTIATFAGLTFVLVYKLIRRKQGKSEIGL